MCGGPKSALRRELPNHVTLLSLTAEQIDCSLKKKSLGCQQHVHPYSIRKQMKDVKKGFLNKVNLLKRSYFLPINLLADLFSLIFSSKLYRRPSCMGKFIEQ